jgi:hypothetical protein
MGHSKLMLHASFQTVGLHCVVDRVMRMLCHVWYTVVTTLRVSRLCCKSSAKLRHAQRQLSEVGAAPSCDICKGQKLSAVGR